MSSIRARRHQALQPAAGSTRRGRRQALGLARPDASEVALAFPCLQRAVPRYTVHACFRLDGASAPSSPVRVARVYLTTLQESAMPTKIVDLSSRSEIIRDEPFHVHFWECTPSEYK